MNRDNWADPARTSFDPVDEFTAEAAFSDFVRGLAVIVAVVAGLLAWLVYEVAPVLMAVL